MGGAIRIGLVGDRSDAVVAHRAIPLALRLAAAEICCDVEPVWLPTDSVTSDAAVQGFDGLWCVPGSPYRSREGALRAIAYARTSGTPFMGTCGGFQHAVLEYARSVLGWSEAAHPEGADAPDHSVIAPLDCGILEGESTVSFVPGSRLAAAYGVSQAEEAYLCGYSVNATFATRLENGPLRIAANDRTGQVRAVELDGHPFFVATLFQPERLALQERVPPLIVAFLRAAVRGARADPAAARP